jgi:phage-related protein
MPGNLSAAAPSGVLPQSLSTAFTEMRVFPMLAAVYHDGTTERSLIVDGVNAPASIRTWKLSKRLTAAAIATLRSFFEAHSGGLIPFYFYNPLENSPGTAVGSNYDATGVSTQGRHICVFRNTEWAETVGVARTEAALEMAEIA